MIFMGAYTGDRGGSSTDDDDDEPSVEPDENQPELDDFDEPSDETSEDNGSSPVATVPGGDGSGADAPTVPIVEEPPEDDPEEPEAEPEPEPEPEPEEEHEVEDEDEDDEEDEEETVTVTLTVDPLSAASWEVQPVIKRVEEYYGDQVEVEYQLAPVRTFDDPETMRQRWKESTRMPVDASLWDEPPESTELLNSAVLAAKKQGVMYPYLRAIWIEGIAAGENLSEEDVLVNLAENMGLDVEKFEADMEDAEVDMSTELGELPVTEVPIRGYTQKWTGTVHYTDFKQQFIFEGLREEPPQGLVDFVDTHGPVTTKEVMEVYGRERDEAVEKLLETEGIYSIEIGQGTFWLTE